MLSSKSISLGFLVLWAIVAASCANQTPEPVSTVFPTPPKPTASAYPTCPPANLPLSTPPSQASSQAIYVLIDYSGSYDPVRKDAIRLLKDVLRRILIPGDMVAIGLIGSDASSFILPATRIEIVAELPTPMPPPTLTPRPSATILPSPTPRRTEEAPIPSLVIRASTEAKKVETANAKISATDAPIATTVAQQQAAEYNCNLWRWASEVEAIRKNAATAQKQELDSKQRAIEGAFESLPKKPTEYTDIFSAFYSASEFFDRARQSGRYKDLRLLVFSDMEQTAATNPKTAAMQRVNLAQVEALIAMVPYPEGKISEYDRHKLTWEDWFLGQAHIKKISFYPIHLSTTDQLLHALRRNP